MMDSLILQEMVIAKAEPKVIPAVVAWDVAAMMLPPTSSHGNLMIKDNLFPGKLKRLKQLSECLCLENDRRTRDLTNESGAFQDFTGY